MVEQVGTFGDKCSLKNLLKVKIATKIAEEEAVGTEFKTVEGMCFIISMPYILDLVLGVIKRGEMRQADKYGCEVSMWFFQSREKKTIQDVKPNKTKQKWHPITRLTYPAYLLIAYISFHLVRSSSKVSDPTLAIVIALWGVSVKARHIIDLMDFSLFFYSQFFCTWIHLSCRLFPPNRELNIRNNTHIFLNILVCLVVPM